MHRVDPKDAVFLYRSRSGASTDHCLVYGFSGDAVTDADPVALGAGLTRRLARVARIQMRLVPVPADLGYPYWEKHSTPTSTFVTTSAPSGRWTETLRRLGQLVEHPLDPTESAWRAEVVDVVTDSPFADGPVVIVVLRICHAFVDGHGAAAIGRRVFSDDIDDDAVATPSPHRRSPMLAAVHGAVTLPYGIVSYAKALAGDLRRQRTPTDGSAAPPLRSRTALNAAPGPDRSVAIIGRARPDSHAVTVTSVALTAVSVALQRYFGTADLPRDLGAYVPVAVPEWVEWPGANRVVTGSVDLHPDVADLAARARLIERDLHAERTRVLEPRALAQARVLESAPALLLRAIVALGRRVDPPTVLAHTAVTSIDRSGSPLRLAGADCVFTSGFPALNGQSSLNQGVYTVGPTVTLGVVWSPSTIGDGDRYVVLLGRAWDEVVAALGREHGRDQP